MVSKKLLKYSLYMYIFDRRDDPGSILFEYQTLNTNTRIWSFSTVKIYKVIYPCLRIKPIVVPDVHDDSKTINPRLGHFEILV